ncbi:MAG: MerR family transcriptional regulator [Proteobacteria bacterium]|nr:MerR family transcriptional regulator [Pseudomonadota bacterium]
MTRLGKAREISGHPVRVAARMTGLKPELLRAWEARYRAVTPGRSEGGSRLYSSDDLERLVLLRDVVAVGHRIGSVARLSLSELRDLLSDATRQEPDSIERIVSAFHGLDGAEGRRLLMDELATLGEIVFVKDLVLPFLVEVGRRWQVGELSIAAEHLASSVTRSVLMNLIDDENESRGLPRVVLATPSGERHDLGTLVSAVVAKRAGRDLVFLGADVPAEELVDCAIRSNASALALGIVTLPKANAERILVEVRKKLPKPIRMFIGGAGIRGLAPIRGIDRIDNLAQFEAYMTDQSLGGKTTRNRRVSFVDGN